jgi:hypothetical protein
MPAGSFASGQTSQNNSSTTVQANNKSVINSITSHTDNIKDKEKTNKESENKDEKDNSDNNQNDKGTVKNVTDSVYEQDANDQNGDNNGDNNQVDEGTLNDVSDAVYTNGNEKSADEIITMLQGKNISIDDMLKAFNKLSENKDEINKEFPDNKLESYADAFNAKIDNQKDKIQNLHNSLQQLSDLYDKVGELEKAINVQKEAIKADYKDIESYKNLGEDLSKKGDKNIKVFSSGDQVNFDVQPLTKENRTLVPIRAIAESLKSQVAWDKDNQTITLSKDGVQIKLTLGQDTAYVNDKEIKLDTSAESVNGRTMVPVRFISEAFNSTVKWEPVYHTVVIY